MPISDVFCVCWCFNSVMFQKDINKVLNCTVILCYWMVLCSWLVLPLVVHCGWHECRGVFLCVCWQPALQLAAGHQRQGSDDPWHDEPGWIPLAWQAWHHTQCSCLILHCRPEVSEGALKGLAFPKQICSVCINERPMAFVLKYPIDFIYTLETSFMSDY